MYSFEADPQPTEKLETPGSMEERKNDPLVRAPGCESGHLPDSPSLPQTS